MRKYLMADGSVTGYVGKKVFKFRLDEELDGTGGRAIVLGRTGGWAAPQKVNTQEYPTLEVECWADHDRSADKTISTANGEEKAWAVYRVVDPLLHGHIGEWWGGDGDPGNGLCMVTCARLAEPFPVRENKRQREAVYVTARYAVQVVH